MENLIVVDIEGKIPYNIGYVIGNRKGEIFKQRSVILPQNLYQNITLHNKEKNNTTIQFLLNDFKSHELLTLEEFQNNFKADIEKFNIKKFFAYNVSFDKNALNKIIDLSHFNLKYYDINSGILFAKLLTIQYIEYCKENNYITENGNIKTTAEIVYRYLTKENYQQKHTGIDDALMEFEMLKIIFKTHKKIEWNRKSWRLLKIFIEEKGIVL